MSIYTNIKKRRSIRSYLDKKVKHSDICKVLDAGHYAPSSGNLQNWRFIVVRDPDTKETVARCCLEQLWITEAPVVIVVCSDSTKVKQEYPTKYKKFATQNCAAATQNMLLQTHALGLASCWVGPPSNLMKFKDNLKIPENIDVEALITIGYSNEKPLEKRHKIEEVTYFDKYGKRERDVSLFPLAKHLKKSKK
ncbi:MAG: nitroreductase [Nanoarchaeota archaeon]|jgi:nitroreductase|nr:nitroreductase [Nanoarchaeota archaeon]|tara:strand:+ start:13812 stop:14393 length:582 start_codon:yes stop_codon:yes gene_type:complete